MLAAAGARHAGGFFRWGKLQLAIRAKPGPLTSPAPTNAKKAPASAGALSCFAKTLLLYRSALHLLALFFEHRAAAEVDFVAFERQTLDRMSTRLNSSHLSIS